MSFTERQSVDLHFVWAKFHAFNCITAAIKSVDILFDNTCTTVAVIYVFDES